MQENENNRKPTDATESTSGRWKKILEIICFAFVIILGLHYYYTQGNGFYRKIYNIGIERVKDDLSDATNVKTEKFKKDNVDVLSPKTIDCTYGQLRHDVYNVTVPTEWDATVGRVGGNMEVTVYLYQDDSSYIPEHYHTEALAERMKKAYEEMEQELDDAYDEFEDNLQDELDSYQNELQEELQKELQEELNSWE